MRTLLVTLGVVMMLQMDALAQAPDPKLCEPWWAEYAGVDATGDDILALWQFNAGAESADSSGKGHDLTLKGATINPNGRFGACLESYRGWPDEDAPHAAIVPNSPSLTPSGAFSIELWIQPKPELEGYPDSFLIDKKYVSNDDYQIILGPADKQGFRRLRAVLGFGKDSVTYTSLPARLETGVWYHLAFVYDGAGKGTFYLNGGELGGGEDPSRGSIRSGDHHLSIGDRIGSYYHGFPGLIDQVRICQGLREFRLAGVDLVSDRTAFVRQEQAPPLQFTVTNFQPQPMSGAVVRLSLSGVGEKEFSLPEMAPGTQYVLAYALDTSLRPDKYILQTQLESSGDIPYVTATSVPVVIVPRSLPHRMPVLMWGVYSSEGFEREIGRLKQIGFTHVLGLGADFGRIWDAGSPTQPEKPENIATRKRMLNEALAQGLSICASLSPGSWARSKKEFLRVDRQGKVYESRPDICGLFPELRRFCYNVGVSMAQTYGGFPAFDSALIHTEVRDSANPCFHEHDRAAFRQFAGFDVPEQVGGKSGVRYDSLEGFPESRVLPDDYPLYVYYRWYWKHGDGWNELNTAVHEGLKTSGRSDLWTFHDPAVRVASVYGSGGAVDVLSQWTYSYPDPIRIATATDELLAMVAGADHPQQAMKMTQIIWYRSQTAPASQESLDKVKAQSVWEDTDPDAAFITIAPMHLREAFWTKIARPIKGIMYHGWQSLVDTGLQEGYRHTHPQTQHELARLIREVVQPLGPTLVQVPGIKSDVAFLESFASQMFAQRGTYGWGHTWAGDAYLIMQWAGLQPEIIFDETIMQRGLEGFKVLVMMDCDVLIQTVVDRIKAFQAAGGLLVGDDRICPMIKPDIVLKSRDRVGKADEDKAALQQIARDLRERLAGRYPYYALSDNPDVVVYRRRAGATDYLFAINDRREFGEYVGHHGLVMENGLPSEATITVDRRKGFAYDLVAGLAVPTRAEKGKLILHLGLKPCDGRLVMITDREIAEVQVDCPDQATLGDTVRLHVAVVDGRGKPIDAVVPVRVDVLDPEGRPAEFSGYYGAAGGQLDVSLDLATNDRTGTWQIGVRDLASGRVATHYLRVTRKPE